MSEYKSLCERLNEEITRLRAENEKLWHVVGLMTTMAPFMEIDVNDPVGMAHSVVAEQTKLFKEKERLLRLVKRIVEHHEHDEDRVSGWTQWEALVKDARAALEGVTEPASPWRDIESAPRDGTWIFIYKDSWHGAIKAKWDAMDGVDELFMGWVFQDEFLCIGCAEGCLGYNEDIEDGYMPTHWMPLPEPPR